MLKKSKKGKGTKKTQTKKKTLGNRKKDKIPEKTGNALKYTRRPRDNSSKLWAMTHTQRMEINSVNTSHISFGVIIKLDTHELRLAGSISSNFITQVHP